MDRQQHFSLWHDGLGLLVGGGNSKCQPRRSTFAVWQNGHCRHEADAARISRGARSEDVVVLRYGGQECRVGVRVISSRRVELTFSAPGIGRREVQAGFLMKLSPGWRLSTSRQPAPVKIAPNQEVSRAWPRNAAGRQWFRAGRCRVAVPAGAFLYWPQYPFNPYAIDGSAPPESAAAQVGVTLRKGRSRARFVIEVEPGGSRSR
jgi:hypothetical protein